MNMNISQITGQNIKKVRIAEGMTLDRLAKRIHKSKSTLSKYEQGTVKIDLETLKDISDALAVSIHHLLPSFSSDSLPEIASVLPPFQHHNGDHASLITLYLYFIGGAKNKVRIVCFQI